MIPSLTDRDWLSLKYITEGLGCPEIGALVGKDPKTVFYWLRKHEIPTRPRGSDPRQHFQPGVARTLGFRHSEETKRKVGEASRRRGAVPYLKNGVHHLKGKRGAAIHNWKGGITPERQAFYRSEEWKSIVKLVWKRDDAICQRCHLDHRTVDRKTARRFHTHHIVSFAVKSLRLEPSNLVLLCHSCHMWVHSKKNIGREFIKQMEVEL